MIFRVVALAVAVVLQTKPAAPPPDPRADELRALIQQYASGDADAALAGICRLAPNQTERQQLGSMMPPGGGVSGSAVRRTGGIARGVLEAILLGTEIGMCLDTFGRYALSAPLEPAPAAIGLTGRFELPSFGAYRAVEAALPEARAADDRLAIVFLRDWYIVTVSYCTRWRLDCAAALLPAALRDFPDDADTLLLAGSIAEARGDLVDADARLRRALSLRASLVEARVRLGRVLVRRGRVTAARPELERAVADARTAHDVFSLYFGLSALADLDERQGRLTSAKTRRTELKGLQPFDATTRASTQKLAPLEVYHAALFAQLPARIRAMRTTARLTASSAGAPAPAERRAALHWTAALRSPRRPS